MNTMKFTVNIIEYNVIQYKIGAKPGIEMAYQMKSSRK